MLMLLIDLRPIAQYSGYHSAALHLDFARAGRSSALRQWAT
jgi:hypothetical protein